MLDHRGDAGIAHASRRRAAPARSGRAPRCSQQVAARPRPRSSRAVRVWRQRQPRRQLGRGLRPVGQQLEQAQPDAGEQHLRVDEPGAEIEQRARRAAGDRPRQREGGRPALEARARPAAVAQRSSRSRQRAALEAAPAATRAPADAASASRRRRAARSLGQEALRLQPGSAPAARRRPGTRGIEATASATSRSQPLRCAPARPSSRTALGGPAPRPGRPACRAPPASPATSRMSSATW